MEDQLFSIVQLVNDLPMNCYVIGWLIVYVDDKDVTLSNTYGWAREASIHCSYHLLIA